MANHQVRCLLLAISLLAPALSGAGVCEAHYPFDGSLADAGGNGHDGELLDKQSEPAVGARFVPGVSGQALRLAGQSFVRTPLNLQPDDCPQVTITAWLKLDVRDASAYTLVSTGVGDGPRIDLGGHSLREYAGGTILDAPADAARPGIWIFVAGTWDYTTGQMRLYWRNRYVETPIPAVKQAPQEFFWIGANGYYGDVHYIADNLLIDEVRVYDRVLAPLEIAALQEDAGVRTVARVPVLETGKEFGGGSICDAHYPFNGNLEDISGNRYHGQAIDMQNQPSPGALSFVPGRHGQALRLDGAAAMIAPLDLHFSLCPRVTITAWVYLDGVPGGFETITSSGYGAGPALGALGTVLQAQGGTNLVREPDVFATGEWVFVAGVWDYPAGVFRIATPKAKTDTPLNDFVVAPQQDFWVGVNGYLTGLNSPASNLRIDDVRVHGRILDDTELAAVATNAPDEKYALPGPKPDADSSTPTGFGGGGKDIAGVGAGVGAAADPFGVTLTGDDTGDVETTPRTVADMQKDAEMTRGLAAGVADPELQPQGEMPGGLVQDTEEWQEWARAEHQRQLNEKFENEFGPRDRVQVAVVLADDDFDDDNDDGMVAFAAKPLRLLTGPGDPPMNGAGTGAWLPVTQELQELLRLKGTNSYLLITADGRVAITGQTRGRHTAIVNRINAIAANGRPVDLVAENGSGYIIISGTEVKSSNAPPGVVMWAETQLRLRAQITAIALLGDGAWIGVSERGVIAVGIDANDYGGELRRKAAQLAGAGERIEDISVAWSRNDSGGLDGSWAIATDQRIYFQNDADCDNHEQFGSLTPFEVGREWNCHVPVPPCPSNRPTWSFNDMESPANKDVWDINVLVTIGVADYDGEEIEKLGCWVESSLRRTEALFDRSPAMRLHLKTRRETAIGGQSLSQLVFASGGDYRRFMEDNFDIVAPTNTSGYFQVIVTDRLCIGTEDGRPDCIDGRATFPHAVEPFSRKYGIALIYKEEDDTVLAHEFGHYLGLKHTFEPYGITTNTCNKDYDANWLKMKERYCRSCLSGMDLVNDTCQGQYNVMDYCRNPNPPHQTYINDCQERRASNTRDRYMKNDGRTKYNKMQGSN